MDISPIIREKAPLILAEIQKASSVLLHCHPSPDPDSVGSALAMKFALEQLGKKATVIKGDSDIPEAFMHFPGAGEIVMKSFAEIDFKDFDLFICLDSAAPDRVTLHPDILKEAPNMINIDHHRTNIGFGSINLIESIYPAAAQILFDLFSEWGLDITPDIAANLFIGIYTDTGGFKFDGTTMRTFQIAGKLTKIFPAFAKLISDMENSNTPSSLRYQALALNSIETFLGSKVALSMVPFDSFAKNDIPLEEAGNGYISSLMRTVVGWEVVGSLTEAAPGKVRISFRARDASKYDVSKLAASLGGGGHKAAAGATLDMSLAQARDLVVAKAKELYNL